MTTPEPSSPSPRGPRFGAGSLVLVALAAAGLALGGSWFLHRDHDHGSAGGGPAAAAEQWQCPMHPTIVQDHPGDCPICGMKLVKVAGAGAAAAKDAPAAAAHDTWQCPMHPTIVQDHPGDCPICGMKLVKVAAGAAGAAGAAASDAEGLATVNIDPARQQLIGLRTVAADRGAVGGAWRTTGRVAVDETRVHHVNVKVGGFVQHAHGDFVGKAVRRGEPLFALYSPELLAAQEEYLLALRTRDALKGGGAGVSDGDELVAAARRKLELWDVSEGELAKIARTGQPVKDVMFYAPATGVITRKDVVPGMRVNAGDMPYEIVDLSRVWVVADVYESELRHVKVGMSATLTLKAYPNRTFQGRVAFIAPLLDPKTRSVNVRLEFGNPTGELKPEMFGEVVLQGRGREGLRIPSDAVIDSGTKSVVFVALGDGKFQPREVELGDSDGAHVEVVTGLREGDQVVTRANFLIDSESRLRASLAAMGAGAPATPAAAGQGDAHQGHAP
ncbi:MAG: efflux RND transporter periplasmic adaptor subunit [Anaeromyxobacter sp.]